MPIAKRRRRILQGLSALSVASSLPAFAFPSEGAAQFEQFDDEPLKGRVELLSQRGSQLELAFHVQSATAQRVMRRYQVLSSFVRYAGGETNTLATRLPQTEARNAPVRRLPPPIPSIAVRAGEEVELGQFSATIARVRGERTMAHFRFRVGTQTLDAAPIRILA